MNINLACGSQLPDGWINVDYSLGARLAKLPLFRFINRKTSFFNCDWDDRIFIHNLIKPLPWKNNSVSSIYSSHTLEHMSRKEGLQFLGECYRVLKPEGVIRIVVPDLGHIVNEYTEGRIRADEFTDKLGVLYKFGKNPIKNKLTPFFQFPHKCMYDQKTLLTVMNDIGFQVESRKPFDSNIKDIENVEVDWRTEDSVIVEGKKSRMD